MKIDKKSIQDEFFIFLVGWVDYLKNISGYSKHTYESYKRDVLDFYNFCKQKELDEFKIDKYILKNYLFELNERQSSRATVARRISSLKSFYKHALREKKNSSFRYFNF